MPLSVLSSSYLSEGLNLIWSDINCQIKVVIATDNGLLGLLNK
jgi:hypothetical protein